nr:TetR/AcrR family transcriptional regulator [Acidaminobacter sp. JC074]
MFIDACIEAIKKNGLDKISIRSIAESIEYNSATLYNYFDNLDHLIAYAACSYLQNAIIKLKALNVTESSLDYYIKVWEIMSKEGFFYSTFISILFKAQYKNFSINPIKDYFKIYHDQINGLDHNLVCMITELHNWKTDNQLLKNCANDGYFNADDTATINQMITHIFGAMVINKNDLQDDDYESYAKSFLKYLKIIIEKNLVSNHDAIFFH